MPVSPSWTAIAAKQVVAKGDNYCVAATANGSPSPSSIGFTMEGTASAITSNSVPDTFEIYEARIPEQACTLVSPISAGATSLVFSNSTLAGYVNNGSFICVGDELIQVASVSGTTITVPATQRAHAGGVPIYLLSVTPAANLSPQPITPLIAYDLGLSQPLTYGPGVYICVYINNDTNAAYTRSVTIFKKVVGAYF